MAGLEPILHRKFFKDLCRNPNSSYPRRDTQRGLSWGWKSMHHRESSIQAGSKLKHKTERSPVSQHFGCLINWRDRNLWILLRILPGMQHFSGKTLQPLEASVVIIIRRLKINRCSQCQKKKVVRRLSNSVRVKAGDLFLARYLPGLKSIQPRDLFLPRYLSCLGPLWWTRYPLLYALYLEIVPRSRSEICWS